MYYSGKSVKCFLDQVLASTRGERKAGNRETDGFARNGTRALLVSSVTAVSSLFCAGDLSGFEFSPLELHLILCHRRYRGDVGYQYFFEKKAVRRLFKVRVIYKAMNTAISTTFEQNRGNFTISKICLLF